ncbi:MAG: TIGR03663 family protein [Anaerolineae bacterium]|nr:TIGR03663 family protein [Anaerolineae bacterium]MDW8102019.1 TIGR03663 family protein [Anaerolineae bacterium]
MALDKPVSFKLDREKMIYLIFLIVAIFSRFWDLGTRAMSHDESLHSLFSYYLYSGRGYQHNPMMHGPFLFHSNALIYFLFGVSDFTARILPALFGVVLVILPYFMRRWLGSTGALLTSFLLLISPSFLYYSRYIRNDIYIAVWNSLLVIALFRFLEEREHRWLYLGAAVLSLAIATKEVTYITGFIGVVFILSGFLWESLGAKEARTMRFFLTGAVAALIALILTLSAIALEKPALLPKPVLPLIPYISFFTGVIGGILTVGVIVRTTQERPFAPALRAISSRALGISIIIFLAIHVTLFTTFFTNPYGLVTGIPGSIAYWLAQHGVQRGGQPWYYYLMLLPLYEFLPLILGTAGLIYYLFKPQKEKAWFQAFLACWFILSLVIYSWAGEKMPWLVLHPALPLVMLGGMFGGQLLERIRWKEWWEKGGPIAFILLIPTIATLLQVLTQRPFQGLSLQKLSITMRWLAALIALGAFSYLLYLYFKKLGGKLFVKTLGLLAGVFLALLTIRFAWMASFINYDNVKELIVYAHGTPDIKIALAQIDLISLHTVGDRQIKFAYDDDSTWPLEWYFRDYPNRVYYGSNPTREALDAPIVIVGPKNEYKVKPFLGDQYYRFAYRLVWWPREDYKGLTPARLWKMLKDPEIRRAMWDVFLYRRYKTPLTQWPYVHYFYLYVRKDVYQKVWELGVAPPPAPEEIDPYARKLLTITPSLEIGTCGAKPGQFLDPRNLAVDAEGNIYVVDSGNHRIQKFGPNGQFILQWGSFGSAPGQFSEPWGIAVDEKGYIYVADTWNHRIQKFDSQGNFITSWGHFVNTEGKLGQPGAFWGPRTIAIDRQGNLYVADTGNKRIQKFSPEGLFLGQWGGFGTQEGFFDEPVGIALDAQGNIYVADTWNRRIQKFDENFYFIKEWRIHGWESQSVVNKPYLAISPDGRLFVTDPEFHRILAFDLEGNFLFSIGRYDQLNLPIGLAVDKEGNLYVADSGSCRILKFTLPPQEQ